MSDLDYPPLPKVQWYPLGRVGAFQRRHGLTVDGIAGRKTWDAIEEIESLADTRRLRRFSYGGKPIKDGIDRDPRNLLPGFAEKLEELFRAMRKRGFDPLLWEGYRSPNRADELSQRGTGIRLSMHCLGAAADVLDAAKLWSATGAFWRALGEEAETLGLTWGGTWRRPDRPHVQAVRVSEQDEFRAMTDEQRARRVA